MEILITITFVVANWNKNFNMLSKPIFFSIIDYYIQLTFFLRHIINFLLTSNCWELRLSYVDFQTKY